MADDTVIGSAPENILRRVRALLARAEHENTPEPEREASQKLAFELLEKYSIDQAMLDAAGPKQEKIIKRMFDLSEGYRHEKAMLLYHIGTVYDMKGVMHGGMRAPHSLTLLGYESDMAAVDLLFTSLLLQQSRALSAEKTPYWLERGEVAVWKRSFMKGFTDQVYARLRSARERAKADRDRANGQSGQASASASTELVLTSRKNAIEAEYDAVFTGVKKAKRAQRSTYRDALQGGRAAGARADIGGTKLGKTRRGALGN